MAGDPEWRKKTTGDKQTDVNPGKELAEPNALIRNRNGPLNQEKMGDSNKYFLVVYGLPF